MEGTRIFGELRRAGLLVCLGALGALALGAPAADAKIVVAQKTAPMPLSQKTPKTLEVNCPGDLQALSGGWDARGAVISIFNSYRSDRGQWTISAIRVTNDLSPVTVKAFAYCVPRRSIKAVSADVSTDGSDDLTATAKAECAGSRKPVASGFRIPGFDPESFSGLPFQIQRIRNAIKGGLISASSDPVTMNVIAYCARSGKPKQRRAQVSFGAGDRTLRTPKCRRSATAAGFKMTTKDDQLIPIDRFQRVGSRWTGHFYTPDATAQTVKLFAYCP